MNAFTIAGFVGLGVILMGIIMSGLMLWLSRLVTVQQITVEKEQTAYNPAVTMGHKVPVNAGPEEQLVAARKEAARRAAGTPRWGNMRIGRKGAETTKPASSALKDDPMSAVRIATFHTWSGARTGIPAGGVPEAGQTVAPVPVSAPSKKPEDLVPGKDYPFIEITDQMSPADVRNARITNVKARSEAIKALKETEAAAPAPVAASPAQAAAPAVSMPEPDLIEITDSMPPDEVRQARIANAKAQSAYKKALKEAEASQPAAAPAPVATQPAAAPAVSMPEPDLIEITDSMPPDEVRQARIANAKAQSAYMKALKEAEASQPAVPPTPAATAPAAAVPPAAPTGNGNEAALAAIPKPDLIEISDDMDPADVRNARINNAKALSAYKKALKEAGIDPASVDI